VGRDLNPVSLDDARRARDRIGGIVVRTPLVRFETGANEDGPEIWLKLENLQPIGSFKLRGAVNRMRAIDRQQLVDGGGAYTASAGNMAQGVAYAARQLGVPARVIVPDSAPAAKLDAIRRLGGEIVAVPYDDWWNAMRDHGRRGMPGVFIHPFADADVMAGNGTIALEIHEDLGDVDAILVPWGGGGLASGIASVARALRPSVRVFACEVEGATPLSACFAAGRAVTIENRRSFVDGMGGRGVLPEIWPLARSLIADSLVVSVEHVAQSVGLLASRARVVAEGAGAAALAAALGPVRQITPRPARVVCIVSGGNIDASILASILSGSIPR